MLCRLGLDTVIVPNLFIHNKSSNQIWKRKESPLKESRCATDKWNKYLGLCQFYKDIYQVGFYSIFIPFRTRHPKNDWRLTNHLQSIAINIAAKLLARNKYETRGAYRKDRKEIWYGTDEDGLVSSVLSDFSESDGSRHEQQRQPSLCPAHTSYPYVLSKDCPVLLPWFLFLFFWDVFRTILSICQLWI